MHACRCRAIHERIYIHSHVRACTRRWLLTNADGAADARVRSCASRHPYTPRCTSVNTDAHLNGWAYHTRAHAHAPMESTRTFIHKHLLLHTYVRRCMHVVMHVSWARACAAPDSGSHTHTLTRTRTCMEPTRTRKTCTRTHTHTHTHTWCYTSSGRALVLRRRSRRSRAHARALMHTRARTLKCMLRANSDVHPCAPTHVDDKYISISVYRYR